MRLVQRGMSLSIPLGGTYREQAALEAEKQAAVARASVDRERREIEVEVEVATQVAEVASSLERWRLAEQATGAASDAARLTQRA